MTTIVLSMAINVGHKNAEVSDQSKEIYPEKYKLEAQITSTSEQNQLSFIAVILFSGPPVTNSDSMICNPLPSF